MIAGNLVRVDEPELLRLQQLEPPCGGCLAPAQVALYPPVQPAAGASPHHEPVEEILLGNLEHVLKDAELRPSLVSTGTPGVTP